MNKNYNPIAEKQLDELYSQLTISNSRMDLYKNNRKVAEERNFRELDEYWKDQYIEALETSVNILRVIDALLETFERRKVKL